MKKFKFVFIILLMIGMVGCAGVKDYEIELINGFKLIRTSAKKVHIGSSEYSYDEVLVPILDDYENGEYVVSVGHDDRYIIAKTNLDNYYLLDTKEIIVSGPLTEKEFLKEKEKIPNNILLENIDTKKVNL